MSETQRTAASVAMVRYRVRADRVDANLAAIRAVYEELEATRPDGLRYASFQLEDDVTFVELVEGGGQGRLSQIEAFVAYRDSVDTRCEDLPVVTPLRRVGAYRLP